MADHQDLLLQRRLEHVANIMIISVLERGSESGLCRALGATQGQIRVQFLGESVLVAVIGGVVGVLPAIRASRRPWHYERYEREWIAHVLPTYDSPGLETSKPQQQSLTKTK